jgi:rfaE bifunctional protein kinase chain/domain
VDRLLELIETMDGKPILVVADLVADRFINGSPKRISREAPVLILSYEGETMVPGGGANAIANVKALGGVPLVLGFVGDDLEGEALLAELERREIDTSGVGRRVGVRTPTKTRILAGGRHAIKQQVVRYDIEDPQELSLSEFDFANQQLEKWQGRAQVAIVSDYGYGSVPPLLIPSLRQSLGAGGLLLADSRYRLSAFRGLNGATPNEEEAENLLGHALGEDLETTAASARELRSKLASASLLITRGSSGMVLTTGESCAWIPVHGTDQVADVTGAGDTVIGTFGLALAAGGTPIEAALLANYAGGVVVMKSGTATLDRLELRLAVESDQRPVEELRWATS